MATIFVSSVDGNNADSGADWTNAKQTVAGALAIAASNDVIKVDSAHNFSAGAAITWTPPAGNVAIISVNRAGGDAWLAGAAESVGASSNALTVAGAAGSSMFVYGMVLNGGTNASTACDIILLNTSSVMSKLEMRSCTLDIKAASTTAQLNLGAASGATVRRNKIILDGCTIIASGSRAGTLIQLGCIDVEMISPTLSMTGATKPASLFEVIGVVDAAKLLIRDGDISGYAVSGGAYFTVTNWMVAEALLKNLRTSGTPSLVTGSWPGGSGAITLRNVDSADTINVFEYRNAYGTITENTTTYLDSGAQFNSGGVSWQIVTTAAAGEYTPFVTPLLEIWGTNTGAQTAEIEMVRDSATALTDREIWSEFDYPASASFPNYTAASNRNANPFTGSGANQPSSSAAWTGTGGFSNVTKQKLQHGFTAAEVGLLQARVAVGKASETLYLNAGITNVT